MSQSDVRPAPVSKAMLWAGRVTSAVPAVMLLLSAGMKLAKSPQVVDGFAKLGYPGHVILAIGVVELVSTVLYIVPRTAVLGAILLTGYLGGAIDTHVRVGDPFVGPLVFGVLVWLGLYLRDRRIRALMPFRKV